MAGWDDLVEYHNFMDGLNGHTTPGNDGGAIVRSFAVAEFLRSLGSDWTVENSVVKAWYVFVHAGGFMFAATHSEVVIGALTPRLKEALLDQVEDGVKGLHEGVPGPGYVFRRVEF